MRRSLLKKKRITIADVAELAGVSPVTASLALNHSPRVVESTVKTVSEAAKKLGYKNLRARRTPENLSGTEHTVWCLVFPYNFDVYTYTKLDLLIIDTLEAAACANNAVLQITRLDKNMDLPATINAEKISHVFIKSCNDIAKISSLQRRRRHSIILFGFNDNYNDGIQIMHNKAVGIDLIAGAAKQQNCRKILQIDLGLDDSTLTVRKHELLQNACSSRGLLYQRITGTEAELVNLAQKIIRESKEKIAVVALHEFGNEQDCIEKIPAYDIIPGKNIECIISEYDRKEMKNAGFYYLDMKGREIIQQAVFFAQFDQSSAPGQFLVNPEIFYRK